MRGSVPEKKKPTHRIQESCEGKPLDLEWLSESSIVGNLRFICDVMRAFRFSGLSIHSPSVKGYMIMIIILACSGSCSIFLISFFSFFISGKKRKGIKKKKDTYFTLLYPSYDFHLGSIPSLRVDYGSFAGACLLMMCYRIAVSRQTVNPSGRHEKQKIQKFRKHDRKME